MIAVLTITVQAPAAITDIFSTLKPLTYPTSACFVLTLVRLASLTVPA
jgi:hypothetical protein